ncbi:MAG: nucleoside recognition domain-containing protein, partial [Peptococcales bacterium]
GKQVLTMCMGFGCNAAGIISCRIIESPREKLIAILTNNFVPCNGRFPTLIALAIVFMGGIFPGSSLLIATTVVMGLILIGIAITLLTSLFLSKTILKGIPSTFTLELPPFRKPQIGKVIVRSIFDRTIFVLTRAILIAAPAGLIIWFLANTYAGEVSLLAKFAGFLDPFAKLMGLDGFILTAFIVGLPANEIVLPILIMSYLSTGAMLELGSLQEMGTLFINNGWTWLTALCTMLFSLLHYPCGTTLWTIFKETKSIKWTLLAFLIPTSIAIGICIVVAQTIMALGLV